MLSPDQIKARVGKLTASRVACLMTGDAAAIMRLYREMIGEEMPEDLSHIWPVRLGIATEHLQLDWYEEKNNDIISRRGEVVISEQLPWAACTLDGWIETLQCPIEVKHTGGREPLEVIIERYSPQLHWQMLVTNARQIALSVIFAASEPIVEFIDRDDDYIAEMVRRGQQFMSFVERQIPPVTLPPVAAPIIADKIVDMSADEKWQRHARQWLQVKGAADTAKESEKVLKSLVPDDAKKAFGCGTRITRDRAGRLSLREDV